MNQKTSWSKRLLSLSLSALLAFGQMGGVSVALAEERSQQELASELSAQSVELTAGDAAPTDASAANDASADPLAGAMGIEGYLGAYGAQPQDDPAQLEQPAQAEGGTLDTQSEELETQAVSNPTVQVTVGIPSMANSKKDAYVGLSYTDSLFNERSQVYNDDLAYASICLAGAAGNSNEGGTNWASKSKNIISFMQQTGCKDVQVNDGYKAIPTELANIGVAVGYKDIKVDKGDYRLFVIGVRGISYMGEWAGNLRIGTSGNHQGFQEARDGVLGFVMPYIKDHVEKDQKVKIWISGFSRAGATSNLVARWLHCWILDRITTPGKYQTRPRTSFNMAGYNDAYRSDHTVLAANYSKEQLAYTERVAFDVNYVDRSVQFSNADLYAYPVAAPQGAVEDKTVGASRSSFEPPIHNLINPDDYVPQVAMSWFGFSRYSTGYDHDVTGYYEQGKLNSRDTALGYRVNERTQMARRLNTIQPGSNYAPAIFRQRYFSKAGTVGNAVKKGAKKFVNFFKKVFDEENDPWLDLAIDSKGEGNKYISKNKELAGNQGKYFEEFMRFFAGSFGVNNRSDYVNGGYQRAFELICRWLMGLPDDQMAKLSGLLGEAAKKSLDSMLEREKITLSYSSNPVAWAALQLTKVPGYNYVYYVAAGVLAVYGKGDNVAADFVAGFFNDVLNQLGVSHTAGECQEVGSALAKMVRGFFDAEQSIAKFCLFHTLTLALNGGEIGTAHWPALYLGWQKQAKPATAASKVSAQAEGDVAVVEPELAEGEHAVYIRSEGGLAYAGVRRDGDILGSLALPELYQGEGTLVESWDLRGGDGSLIKEGLDGNTVITSEFPRDMYLVANVKHLARKHVVLWSNLTGSNVYEQDTKVAEFDVYEGGYVYITDEEMPEGFDPAEFGVAAYRNALPAHDEGFFLEGWTCPDEDLDLDFDTTGNVSFANLPDGDTVNLYGVWTDVVAYGLNYHANRDASDTSESLEFQVPSEGQIVLDGYEGSDEYPKLAGKSLVGWNTKPDGSGTSYRVDQLVEPTELGLDTREAYLADLASTDLDDDEAYEAFVERHTVELYAQWDDAKNGWYSEGGAWYYYVDGARKTGWLWDQASEGWYHFGANGVMDVGWTVVDGKRYLFNPASDGSLGKMLSGWQQDAAAHGWRYLNPLHDGHFGEAVTGWVHDGSWYLLDGDGLMATGWRWSEGSWYLLGQDGRMLTGWQKVGDAWYYLYETVGSPQGACALNTVTPDGYRVNETGAWVA